MYRLARQITLLLAMLFTLLPLAKPSYANPEEPDPTILYPDAIFSEDHVGMDGILYSNSIIPEMALYPEILNGRTVIRVSVCTDAPHFQFRWSMDGPGGFMTEIFVRPTSCPPSFGNGSRVVVDALPGQVFTIYVWSSQQLLAEAAFMQRAARYRVTVTALGQIHTERITPLTVPAATAEEPSSGATVQGTISVSGWAINAASWDGPGVDQVEIRSGGQLLGTANYGQSRPDVGAAYGDPRFNNSGYSYQLDTTRLTNGSHVIQAHYRSTIDGTWHMVERGLNVNNTTARYGMYLPLVRR